MAGSQQLITDITTVINNGANGATLTRASAANGPIMDYLGNVKALLLKFQEAQQLAILVIQDTDPTDSANLALLQGLTGSLV